MCGVARGEEFHFLKFQQQKIISRLPSTNRGTDGSYSILAAMCCCDLGKHHRGHSVVTPL
jgi:hypothetical protein